MLKYRLGRLEGGLEVKDSEAAQCGSVRISTSLLGAKYF